jgi:outer membrane protein assembly factor BamB
MLLGEQSLELLSPVPLDEAAQRLKDKSESWRFFGFRNPLRVSVSEIDADAVQFKMSRDAGRNLNAEVIGVLHRWENETTLITGQARISRSTYVIIIALMAMQLAVFHSVGFLSLWAVMAIAFLGISLIERNRLVKLLYNTLGAECSALKLKTNDAQVIRMRQYRPSGWDRLKSWASYAFVILFVLLFFTTWTGWSSFTSHPCTTTSTGPRAIQSNSFPVTTLWTTRFESSGYGDNHSLVIGPGQVLAVTCDTVTAFDQQAGHVVWQSPKTNDRLGDISGRLIMDLARSRLYTHRLSGQILAVSSVDGKILWANGTSQLTNGDTPSIYLLPRGALLVENNSSLWSVDPATGDLQPPSIIHQADRALLYLDDMVFTRSSGTVQAVNTRTGERLWSVDVACGCQVDYPVVAGDILLLQLDGHQTAIDWRIGKQLWAVRDHEIVTNTAVQKGIVYVMDSQARLLMLDVQSGKELGSVQFAGPGDANRSATIDGSTLDVVNNLLAVYFADTQTLSMMQLINPKTR